MVHLSDDGTHLLLTHEGSGEEFALKIDDRLRGAVVSDRARQGSAPLEKQSRLRPKEIQARLRAGESSESVAAAAEVPIERILRYAGPVLAEREYTAGQARRCALRRNGREGPAQILDEAVGSRLDALGIGRDHATWDAWRTPEGRWAVTVTFAFEGDEHRAMFSYDPLGRVVVTSDAKARALVGEAPMDSIVPPPAAPAAPEPAAEPLSREAHRLRLAPPPAEARPDTEDTIDLSHSIGRQLAAGQGPRAVPADRPSTRGTGNANEPDDLDPDEVPDLNEAPETEPAAASAPADELPPPPAPAAARKAHGTRTEVAPEPEDAEPDEPAEPEVAAASERATGEKDEREHEEQEQQPVPEQPARRRAAEARRRRARAAGGKGKGRSAVPSWDDILFGGGRGSE
nr:septation protein SepH [Actinopolymorpha cephalotaxi]